MSPLLAFCIGWPLLLALLLYAAPLRRRAGWLAPLAVLPAMLLWLMAPAPLTLALPALLTGVTLELDGLAQVFLGLTVLLWLVAGLHVWRNPAFGGRGWPFVLFWLITLSGNLLWVLAGDAVSFYLGFTMMSLGAWGLVVHAGSEAARRAGRVYLIMALLGEMLILAGILLRVGAAGTTELAALAVLPAGDAAVALLLAGFGIKVGVPLLHMWLPLAHPAAPVPASAVLSGVMLKAGVMGWLRFLPGGESLMPLWGMALILIGLFAMFAGVLVGLSQQRPKTILAYSSVSQMGWLTAAVGLWLAIEDAGGLLLAAIALFALHHGLAKGALFLGVGLFKGSAIRGMPGIFMWLPALALAGLPLTSGMIAKEALKPDFARMGDWLTPMLLLAGMGTLWLMLHLFRRLSRETGGHAERPDTVMLGGWLSLVVVGQGLFWLWPMPGWTAGMLDAAAIWKALWPALLAGGLFGLLWRFRRLPDHWLPAWPEGDLIVPVERGARRLCRMGRQGSRRWRGTLARWQSLRHHLAGLLAVRLRALADQERLLRRWGSLTLLFLLLWGVLMGLIAL